MTDFKADLVAADGTHIALEGEHHVGRSSDCEITIDDSRVSRRHAVLRLRDQAVFLEDLDSANGTMVNGIPVKGEVQLVDGDKIRFDLHGYVLAIQGGAASAGAAGGGEAATELHVDDMDGDDAGATSGGADLPGSWVDSGTGNQTMILAAEDAVLGVASVAGSERSSDLPHLIVVDAEGERAGIIELKTTGAQDVWEIGRATSCEIMLNAPSVSERHAQLIHLEGRWRIVNLVSTNGIFVNGDKKLTAYLADRDEIVLGNVTLVFRTAAGVSQAASRQAETGRSGVTGTARLGGRALFIPAALLIVIAGLAWVMS